MEKCAKKIITKNYQYTTQLYVPVSMAIYIQEYQYWWLPYCENESGIHVNIQAVGETTWELTHVQTDTDVASQQLQYFITV